MWTLGSSLEVIVELLRLLGLPKQETGILNLSFVNGAIVIILAKELGFKVLGVDTFKLFIREPRIGTKVPGGNNICEFKWVDLGSELRPVKRFNVLVYAEVDNVLDHLGETVKHLSQAVRPGHYLVKDEAFSIP